MVLTYFSLLSHDGDREYGDGFEVVQKTSDTITNTDKLVSQEKSLEKWKLVMRLCSI